MRAKRAAIAVVCTTLGLFTLAPVVNSPIKRPDQLAFLGPDIPAYESLSCAIVGYGTSYWESNASMPLSSGSMHVWSYALSCPTFAAYNKSNPE